MRGIQLNRDWGKDIQLELQNSFQNTSGSWDLNMKSIEISWNVRRDISWGCLISELIKMLIPSVACSQMLLVGIWLGYCFQTVRILCILLTFKGSWNVHPCSQMNPKCFLPPIRCSNSATNAGWKVQICDMKCFGQMFVSEVSKFGQYSGCDAKAKNELRSLNLVVHLTEHAILRNIDDGKVEMFWWKKQ